MVENNFQVTVNSRYSIKWTSKILVESVNTITKNNPLQLSYFIYLDLSFTRCPTGLIIRKM